MAYTKKTKDERIQEQIKNSETIEDSLLNWFKDGSDRAKRESYIHSNELKLPPLKLTFNNKTKEMDVKEFSVQELVQIETDEFGNKLDDTNIHVYATSKQMMDFLNHNKNDFVLDNAVEGFDPDKPMKGMHAKLEVVSSFFSCYDKEEGKQLTGGQAFRRIKELKDQGKNQKDIGEILTSMKYNYKPYKYHALEDFKDVLPQHIKDKIPQFSMQEELSKRKMSPDKLNMDAYIDAQIVKKAMIEEYEQIDFKEKDLNVAYCSTMKDKSHSTVYMAPAEKYTSHSHYLAVMVHEFCHATQSIDKRSVGKTVNGVNAKEEAIVSYVLQSSLHNLDTNT
ncbi:hypothetical protein AB6C47_018235 [Vibrio cyclitrophicus]